MIKFKKYISQNVFYCYAVSFDFFSMNIFQVLTGHTERILGLTISPCGQYVMSASSDESLRLWWCFKVDKSAKLKSATKSSRLVQSVR